MPTINEFKATNTAYQEMLKCQILRQKIGREYGEDTTQYSTLLTLERNWKAIYDTQLAAATIDGVPSSIDTEITALQTTYNNR